MGKFQVRVIALAVALSSAVPAGRRAEARVLSYAPVTAQQAIPAVQARTNRRFVLVESDSVGAWGGAPSASPFPGWSVQGRLVVHDSSGAEEPRVVFPQGGGSAAIALAAAQEAADGRLGILVVSDAGRASAPGAPTGLRPFLSLDGGTSWKELVLPDGLTAVPVSSPIWTPATDFGGPFCRGRSPNVRIGGDRTPFALVLTSTTSWMPAALAAVTAEGALRPLVQITNVADERTGWLVGGSPDGSSVLLSGRVHPWGTLPIAVPQRGVYRIGLDGGLAVVLNAASLPAGLEGWLTPGGAAYLEVDWAGAPPAPPLGVARGLYLASSGSAALVAQSPAGSGAPWAAQRVGLFAIPAAGNDGAWVVQRAPGLPTVLSRHTPGSSLTEAWRDPAAPEVEALHAGSSGRRLLVQVHRPRPQADQRMFKDPALGLWEAGQPAPRAYDELFLVEQPEKGFVHLDVDAVAEGARFVFDGGVPQTPLASPPSGGGPAAGGSDVVQEWGVVAASLKQRLVIPAVARTAGAGGSFWKTDLVLRNPSAEPLSLEGRLVQESGEVSTVSLSLGAREVRVVPDAVLGLFGLASASGALFLEPEGFRAIEATSKTSTEGPSGTFGMALGASDVMAHTSTRFPVSFAGALLGDGFRTNAGAVNVGTRPGALALRTADGSGFTGRDDVQLDVAPGGFVQRNGLASLLGVPAWQAGALSAEPQRGELIPFTIAIDDVTNDPTGFPPDLPASIVRTIPAVVHVDGRDGARFRSDLFLYNSSDSARSVTLAVRRWDGSEPERTLALTLLPHEARVIRDGLKTAFGLEGVARLRFSSGSALDTSGVRVTSRTYTAGPAGGTFGLVVPPLGSFQSAGPGEALEILGPTGGSRSRTNLALVDLTAFPDGTSRRVKVSVLDGGGRQLDSFEANVPSSGGIQVDDLFRVRGLGDGPPACVLRIEPASGLIGAYATTIDQGTNDPAYFAAALASQD